MDIIFQFDSLQDFLTMSGHGPYVWFSYATVLSAMLFFGFRPNWQFKQFLKEQNILQRQQQSIAASKRSER
ncbi:MAG: heme exporter protein CcmD [Cellvibrionaceae bacterium]